MKFFALIMASLVLLLSFTPCMDESANSTKAKAEFSKVHDQQKDNDTDNCSPFCTCNCCAGFTFNIFPFKIEYLDFLSSLKKGVILPTKVSGIALPIWQPPQLS